MQSPNALNRQHKKPQQAFTSVRLKHNSNLSSLSTTNRGQVSALSNYQDNNRSPILAQSLIGTNQYISSGSHQVNSGVQQTKRGGAGSQLATTKRESSIFESFAPLTEKHARLARYQMQQRNEEKLGSQLDQGRQNLGKEGSRRIVPLRMNKKERGAKKNDNYSATAYPMGSNIMET